MTATIPNSKTSKSATSKPATSNSSTSRKRAHHVIEWPLLPDDFELPDDPVENEAQPRLAAALTNALAQRPALMESALVVSNFALCASVDGRIICKAPDWMYISPVESVDRIRRSYTPHKEGVVPQVVMEFLSEKDCGEFSVQSGKKIGKWHFYEQIIEVPTYVIFDTATGGLEVHTLENGLYKKAPAKDGRYYIADLDLWIGVWEGTHEFFTGFWLRWWTTEGDMLPWDSEVAAAAKAEAEAAKVENAKLLAKLKAAGLA